MYRSFIGALAICLLAATACTSEAEETRERVIAQSSKAADAVLAAWNARDGEELAAATGDEAGTRRFLRALEVAIEDGDITTFTVARAGEVDQPSIEEVEAESQTGTPVDVTVPFEISWSSAASAEIPSLEGEFVLSYSAGEDVWTARLEKSLLWPGIEGARGFDVEYDWLRRGRIKDREGRVIAAGSGLGRRYPFGTVGGTTVGHLGRLTKAEVHDGALGDAGDLAGASGLEAAFQERLGGLPTSTLQVIGRRSKVLETLGKIDGEPGEDVKVTLDMEIQRAAERAYGSTLGGAVVMQPQSGDLLAVVDSSTFDPNAYVGAEGVEPFNRPLAGGYPPGSSLKVVTAAAALDTGTVGPSTTVTGPKEYKGVRNFESGEFGSISFATAVKFSVNTAFAQVAESLGAKKLTRYAEAFGFNRPHAMALAARESSFPEPQDLGDLMWSSVGQAQVLATPLEMASVAATIANGGRRMEPRIDMNEPKTGERVVSRKTAGQLAQMMQAVVEGGTGVNARISGVAVAGKTGTAEVDVAGERKNHAWFICFAPVGAPKVAVAVVSEYGGVGGQVAAPLARAILQSVLALAP